MVRNLPVLYTHDIHRFELNLAMGRGDSEKHTFARTVIGLVGSYSVAIRDLPMDNGVKVREHRGSQISPDGPK
jgi:hypothetical protein